MNEGRKEGRKVTKRRKEGRKETEGKKVKEGGGRLRKEGRKKG